MPPTPEEETIKEAFFTALETEMKRWETQALEELEMLRMNLTQPHRGHERKIEAFLIRFSQARRTVCDATEKLAADYRKQHGSTL